MPFISILRCDGPDCVREDLCQPDPQRGMVPPEGWKSYENKPFCSALCVSRYAALQAQEDLAKLVDALGSDGLVGAGTGQP